MHALPRAARLVCFYNAWRAGSLAADDLPDVVVAGDAAHDVLGIDEAPTGLLATVGRLRRLGADAARLALPVPGDPLGLAGPPALNEAAVEAGEAALFPGAGLALVPQAVGAGVFWHVHPCVRHVGCLDERTAERLLRETLLTVSERLSDLDVATWRPEVADALSMLRSEHDVPLPAGYSPRAGRLAALALRCQTIVALAHGSSPGAVGAAEADSRAQALAELSSAARQALVAACSQVPRHGDVPAR